MGDLPLNLVVSPTKKYLTLSNNGQSTRSAVLLDPDTEKLLDEDTLNTEENNLARLSARFDLSREDAAPDIPFNEVIWKTVRGEDSVMPAPRRSAFVRLVENEEEEE